MEKKRIVGLVILLAATILSGIILIVLGFFNKGNAAIAFYVMGIAIIGGVILGLIVYFILAWQYSKKHPGYNPKWPNG